MDTVGAFIDACCVRDPEGETAAKCLYDRYKQWWGEHGEESMKQNEFGARLAEKGLKRDRTNKGRFWRGLSLTPRRDSTLGARPGHSRPMTWRMSTRTRRSSRKHVETSDDETDDGAVVFGER